MKRILGSITLVSIITLVVYIALYAFWGALLGNFKNPILSLLLIALMTTVAFDFILLFVIKIRKSIGENEVIADYKNRAYVSVFDDFKLIIRREARMLTCMTIIVFICFGLNTLDSLIFEKKTISFITFFFAPMCLFASLIHIPFVGYALSAVLDCVIYIIFLLIYRKKKYNYWMKK